MKLSWSRPKPGAPWRCSAASPRPSRSSKSRRRAPRRRPAPAPGTARRPSGVGDGDHLGMRSAPASASQASPRASAANIPRGDAGVGLDEQAPPVGQRDLVRALMSPPATGARGRRPRSPARRPAPLRAPVHPASLPTSLARCSRRRCVEQPAAGALADVEHLVEAARPAVVGVGHLGVGRRRRVERAQQRHLGPVALVARQPQELVAVRAVHRQHVVEVVEVRRRRTGAPRPRAGCRAPRPPRGCACRARRPRASRPSRRSRWRCASRSPACLDQVAHHRLRRRRPADVSQADEADPHHRRPALARPAPASRAARPAPARLTASRRLGVVRRRAVRSSPRRRPATPGSTALAPPPRPAPPRPRPAAPGAGAAGAAACLRAARPSRPRAPPPAISDFSMGALSLGDRISKSSTWNEPRALTTIRFCRRFSISSRNGRSVDCSTCATSGWTSTSTVSPSTRSPCRRSSRKSS